MKDYSLAALTAFFCGWLVQTVAFALYLHAHADGFSIRKDLLFGAVAFWLFSLAANAIFIQLPRFYIKKLAIQVSSVSFALLSAFYGLTIFALTIGLMAGGSFKQSLPVYVGAVINGFVYGLVFHILWKPAKINL
jgi:hypothetical protein